MHVKQINGVCFTLATIPQVVLFQIANHIAITSAVEKFNNDIAIRE